VFNKILIFRKSHEKIFMEVKNQKPLIFLDFLFFLAKIVDKK